MQLQLNWGLLNLKSSHLRVTVLGLVIPQTVLLHSCAHAAVGLIIPVFDQSPRPPLSALSRDSEGKPVERERDE